MKALLFARRWAVVIVATAWAAGALTLHLLVGASW